MKRRDRNDKKSGRMKSLMTESSGWEALKLIDFKRSNSIAFESLKRYITLNFKLTEISSCVY